MEQFHFVVLILIVIITLVFFFLYILHENAKKINSYYWLNIWNGWIEKEVDKQNKVGDSDLPKSMQRAETCNINSVRVLNKMISTSHDTIIGEIKALIKSGYHGYPMIDLDEVQRNGLDKQQQWKPIWVKFVDGFTGTSKNLPTLKKIVKKMGDEVILLHVSVFWPGVELPLHIGVSKGVLRYHYGLSIPDGDTGLLLDNSLYKWKNGEGVIWSDTLPHKAWNKTNDPRIIIFADIPRKLSPGYNWINRYIHKKIAETDHIKEISKKLNKEGSNIPSPPVPM